MIDGVGDLLGAVGNLAPTSRQRPRSAVGDGRHVSRAIHGAEAEQQLIGLQSSLCGPREEGEQPSTTTEAARRGAGRAYGVGGRRTAGEARARLG